MHLVQDIFCHFSRNDVNIFLFNYVYLLIYKMCKRNNLSPCRCANNCSILKNNSVRKLYLEILIIINNYNNFKVISRQISLYQPVVINTIKLFPLNFKSKYMSCIVGFFEDYYLITRLNVIDKNKNIYPQRCYRR